MPEIQLKKPCWYCDNTGFLEPNLPCIPCNGKGYQDNKDLYIKGIQIQQRRWQEKAHGILIRWSVIDLLELSRDIKYLIPSRRIDLASGRIQDLIAKAEKRKIYLPKFRHTGKEQKK